MLNPLGHSRTLPGRQRYSIVTDPKEQVFPRRKSVYNGTISSRMGVSPTGLGGPITLQQHQLHAPLSNSQCRGGLI
jgi:hypothetical protein